MNYLELKEESARLEKLIAVARTDALKHVRTTVIEFGFTSDQVFDKAKRKTVDTSPRYFDPASGATWSGLGRIPRWLQGKDRAAFAYVPKPANRKA